MFTVKAKITGHVQGVGFRAFTRRNATILGVHGEVRNEPDGSVHVIAQGTRSAVEELLKELREGPALARVEDVNVEEVEDANAYESFSVLRGINNGSLDVQPD